MAATPDDDGRRELAEARGDAAEARADAATGRSEAHQDYVDLRDELTKTRGAVDRLEQTVDRWATATRRGRVWTVVLGGVVVVLLCLVVVVAAVTLWAYRDAQRTDADLVDYGRALFLSGCETSNDARQEMRRTNLQEVEDLIAVFDADSEAPDRAELGRQLADARNETLPDRDCSAELAEVEDTEKGTAP